MNTDIRFNIEIFPNLEHAFFYIILLISGFIVSITGPNVRSVLQSVTAPEVRGTAFAVYNLTDDLGKGFGPVIVDAIVYISSGDKNTAYNVVISFWFICAILLFMMSTSNLVLDGRSLIL